MGSISSRQQESSELWTFILSIPHPREFIGKLKENAIIFKIEKRHSFLKERWANRNSKKKILFHSSQIVHDSRFHF